tara:strand:- start:2563 stop:3021 length:459 start_codon:yes stop_codon:yes gene_type:complete
MKFLKLNILLFFSYFTFADDISIDEMIEYISTEQHISALEETLRDQMFVMLTTAGLNVDKQALNDFLNPYVKDYTAKVEKRVPELVRETYSDEEIIAMYDFLNTKLGRSITSKQNELVKRTSIEFNDDAMEFGQKIGAALSNPEVIQSLLAK